MCTLLSLLLLYVFWIAVCSSMVVLFHCYTLLLVGLLWYVLLLVGCFLFLSCSSLSQGVLLDELPCDITVVAEISL